MCTSRVDGSIRIKSRGHNIPVRKISDLFLLDLVDDFLVVAHVDRFGFALHNSRVMSLVVQASERRDLVTIDQGRAEPSTRNHSRRVIRTVAFGGLGVVTSVDSLRVEGLKTYLRTVDASFGALVCLGPSLATQRGSTRRKNPCVLESLD